MKFDLNHILKTRLDFPDVYKYIKKQHEKPFKRTTSLPVLSFI